MPASKEPQKLLRRNCDIFDNLAEKKRRNITATVKWNRSSASIGMAVLLVRTALTDLDKTQLLQHTGHLTRLQNGKTGHYLNGDGLGTHELDLKLRLTILHEHRNDLAQVLV